MGYPSEAEELKMLQRQQNPEAIAVGDLESCISLEEVEALQKAVRQVKLTEDLQQYLLRLVRAPELMRTLLWG
ncbi:hypothetical protein NON20_04650 [Synechocystis sp. B12]|nr:hypothetical protein NON20_04650 [Synechocystis sp. B12]